MKKIIGVIGPIAAGKDTAAEYISKKWHIPLFEISAHIKEIARLRGIDGNRKNLTVLGRELAADKGLAHLAEKIVAELSSAEADAAVLSGMRQLAQIEYLRANTSLLLIAIDAPSELRFARAKARGKLGEGETLEEFIADEEAENSGTVQQLFECMKLADHTIVNAGRREELEQALDEIVKMAGLF